MHATSAVAIAVVALNAASSLAIPMGPVGEGLVYGRAATTTTQPAVANAKDASDPTKVGSQAKVAANAAPITTTIVLHPRPTTCKKGETPSTHRSHRGHGHQGLAAAHSSKQAGATPSVVARAVSAAATPTGTATVADQGAPSTAAPTRAPLLSGLTGKGHKNRKGGKVFASTTKVGKDHQTTVMKFVKGTHTHCHAPGATPGAKGHAKSTLPKADKDTDATVPKASAGSQGAAGQAALSSNSKTAAAKPDAKLVARAADPLAATPVDKTTKTGAGAAAKGPAANKASGATTTVTVHPHPTLCKPGEKPSTHRGSHRGQGQHRSQGQHRGQGSSASPSGKQPAATPAIVARAVSATPTASGAPSSAAPTRAPQTGGLPKKSGHVLSSKVGKDQRTTVFVKGTHTHCHAPGATPGAKGPSRKGQTTDATVPKNGAGSQGAGQAALSSNKAAAAQPDAKLVAREILERYFSELDELD